jgi:hypothetical protein
MSYDIYLKDPISREIAEVPAHLMIGELTKLIIILIQKHLLQH